MNLLLSIISKEKYIDNVNLTYMYLYAINVTINHQFKKYFLYINAIVRRLLFYTLTLNQSNSNTNSTNGIILVLACVNFSL